MHSSTSSLTEVVERIFTTHRLTRADQQLFMSTLLSKSSISRSEQEQIDKVFDGLRRGLLRVVD